MVFADLQIRWERLGLAFLDLATLFEESLNKRPIGGRFDNLTHRNAPAQPEIWRRDSMRLERVCDGLNFAIGCETAPKNPTSLTKIYVTKKLLFVHFL